MLTSESAEVDEAMEEAANTAQEDATIDWSTIDFSKSRPARTRRQRRWALIVCTKLALPILLSCIYFVVIGSQNLHGLSDIRMDASFVAKMEERKLEHRNVVVQVTRALMASNDTESAAFALAAADSLSHFMDLNYDIYAGRGIPAVAESSVTVKAIMLEDACMAVADRVACNDVFYGILKKGLFSALQSYSGLMLQLLDKRGAANGNEAAVQARFQDPLWSHYDQLQSNVQEILQTLVDLRKEVPKDRRGADGRALAAATAVFVTSMALCNVIYFPRIVNGLNRSIKGTRFLLLLLPEDVITGVKAVTDTMAALTKKLTVY